MTSIFALLKIHKKTMFSPEKTAVNCILKPNPAHQGYEITGLTSFIGLTIEESGYQVYGDSFEITFNLDDIFKVSQQIPTRDWVVLAKLPQLNNNIHPFCIEDIAIDRTLGMCLIKCSGITAHGEGKKIDRKYGGI